MSKLLGNKGEWSEIYAVCYLLAHGSIHAADENLNKLDDIFFPVIKVFRDEGYKNNKRHIEYRLPNLMNAYSTYIRQKDEIIQNKKMERQFVNIYVNDKFICNIQQSYILQKLLELYNSITDSKGRSFSIDSANELLKKLQCTKLSAPPTVKADIGVQLHDINTGYAPICGFSIKSDLGSPPTLLNASRATNFVFEVKGLDSKYIDEINAINTKNKIFERMNAIYKKGGYLCFIKTRKIFEDNLLMIDSLMPKMLSEIILYSYKSGCVDSNTIMEELEKEDPLEYNRLGFYIYKYKKLLCSIALGMMPSKKWNGRDEANGGYIIVKKDGDVVAYHIYNRDKFEDYLLQNTKLDRGATKKHKFAMLYWQEGKLFIDLNLQIRFK